MRQHLKQSTNVQPTRIARTGKSRFRKALCQAKLQSQSLVVQNVSGRSLHEAILAFKSQTSSHLGRSNIIVYEYRLTTVGAMFWYVFLIIQCKRVLYESRDAIWRDAEGKPKGYLEAAHQNTMPPNTTPVYRTVAVGRKICFYKCTHAGKKICGWCPSTRHSFDLRGAGDPRLIERALQFILANH